ncbi:hypothetical protein CLV96_3956 [Leptospira meyeri]|uniref:Uncharacterized protein n=1 Tax=Leptospira meyeri TaxID=29508 RepID=A0A4V3HHP4_LEPME|nr:hypothetical protein [Leptospira meyeri]EKJ86130.1 hypothetical protein LEP1GSC017_3992 [Leptospira meyeri serovar Hardjo str. Went 5]TDY66386.1 hypothetical protein CLV96_3956 [Leptospira meyeri]
MERIKYYTIFTLIFMILGFFILYITYFYLSHIFDSTPAMNIENVEIVYKNPALNAKINLICNDGDFDIINLHDNSNLATSERKLQIKTRYPKCFLLKNLAKGYYNESLSCVENITNILSDNIETPFFDLNNYSSDIYKKFGKKHLLSIIGASNLIKIVNRVDRIEFYGEKSTSILTEDGILFIIYSNLNEDLMDNLSISSCYPEYDFEQQFAKIKKL